LCYWKLRSKRSSHFCEVFKGLWSVRLLKVVKKERKENNYYAQGCIYLLQIYLIKKYIVENSNIVK